MLIALIVGCAPLLPALRIAGDGDFSESESSSSPASAFSRSFPAKREVTASRADATIFSSEASTAATNEGEPVSDPEGDREADSDTDTEAEAALTDSSEAFSTEGDAGGDSDTADETGKDVVSETGAIVVGFTAISGLFCWDSILSPFLIVRNGERSPPMTRAPGFLPLPPSTAAAVPSTAGLGAGAGVAGSTSMSLCEESEKSQGFLVARGGDLTSFRDWTPAAATSSRDMSMDESSVSAKNLETFSTRSMARSAAAKAPFTAVAGDFSNLSCSIPRTAFAMGPSWQAACHARMNRLDRASFSMTRAASSRGSCPSNVRAPPSYRSGYDRGSRPAHPSNAPAMSLTNFLDPGVNASPTSAPSVRPARTSIVGEREYCVSWLSNDKKPLEADPEWLPPRKKSVLSSRHASRPIPRPSTTSSSHARSVSPVGILPCIRTDMDAASSS